MLAAEVPSPLKGLLRNFAPILSKPQQDNLARIVVGFMAHEGERYVANVSDSFVPHKDQSSLNRFVTDAKWDYHELNERRIALVEDELGLRGSKEECTFIIDDTNVERYGGEGVGYHHDSKHGLIRGHNYVTSVCVSEGATYPIDLRLYAPQGTSARPFMTKVELACEMIDKFVPPSRNVTVEFDEWYLCGDIVKHAQDRGFHWMGEARNNRVIFYKGERFHVSDILDGMRNKFVDVEVDGELYQCLQVDGYMPKIGEVRLLINCKADTKDMHFLCTDIKRVKAPQLLKKGLERAKIESFHWDIKNTMGFGDYRFRGSEAAMTHSHLVLLTYSLLLIMKNRLERRSEREQERKRTYSLGEVCRIVRDTCLVSICRWIQDNLSKGLRGCLKSYVRRIGGPTSR
jgi:hypothetical protein